MPEVRHIAISIKVLGNGFLGSVSAHHNYNTSETAETYFPTLDEALDELSKLARDPEKIVAEHPASDDHPF